VLCCDSVSLHPPLANSDHCMVNLSISISIPNENYSGNCNNIPDFARADWASIYALLKSINWPSEFTNCISATQYWDKYLQIISVAIAKYIPVYKSTGITNHKQHPIAIRKLASKSSVIGSCTVVLEPMLFV